ncbi:capsule biosynthesis protein [Sulfurimonas marina]|uniref:Capsular biosynthesis protein n=1 Tax=Sulfurimonas marina TaxID=2590551 RepID=A0A7M1AVG5_9BACT|nr:capsular biosynthesis protein [Sulfurimonas marina]QOP41429.1 capsular biosynthesis protein [Sulfurimonas marina]
MQIFDIVGDVAGKNILLFQGPMGDFFNVLDQKFAKHGAKTFRIGLNAGDQFFADARHFTPYKGTLYDWKKYIKEYLQSYWIDMIFVFGDCRIYQKQAIEIAKKLGIKVFVFEEGYIRPDFITLEENGVNDNSSLPRERQFYDALEYDETKICNSKNVVHIGSTYLKMARQASIYYLVSNLFFFHYPHYQHHRNFSSLLEHLYGWRNFFRKQLYRVLEWNKDKLYKTTLSKKYYFVALQTFEDFQISHHSDYNSIEEFILEVLESFCIHAPKDSYIVFKHHPMDRGKKNYKRLIQNYAEKKGCAQRVKVVYDLHLPTLLKNAIATVTINSTVGISSLYHQTPTICMGRSFYDIDGLTSKGVALDKFWTEYKEVDQELFNKFRCYLIEKTQINGSFYKSL